mmetsp:Transcript_2573/g.6987  ORF Transcript_2573/g.6987 Transcript_2573/m.6987 type:complete len:89 (-) Transcript_2573:623-889(-)
MVRVELSVAATSLLEESSGRENPLVDAPLRWYNFLLDNRLKVRLEDTSWDRLFLFLRFLISCNSGGIDNPKMMTNANINAREDATIWG